MVGYVIRSSMLCKLRSDYRADIHPVNDRAKKNTATDSDSS